MIQKLEAKGVSAIQPWDDGYDHDDVTKIYVQKDKNYIRSIYFDYVKNGQPIQGSCHGSEDSSISMMFEIDHLRNEYLESVEIYYDQHITALQFKTNCKTSAIMGDSYEGQITFTLAVNGKKIVGFHGNGETSVLSLGAYFTSITPTRLAHRGGTGGRRWDDGSDCENVSNINILGGSEGIRHIQVDYVKNGKLKSGLVRGISDSNDGYRQTFKIDHLNNEYLMYVDGYLDKASQVIQGLRFTTSTNRSELIGFDKGTKLSIAPYGTKVIGFHGYAQKNLNSLGAYIIAPPPSKLEMQGGFRESLGFRGYLWDDGSNHDGIGRVCVNVGRNTGWNRIICIRFEYVNRGKLEKTCRRREVEFEEEFLVDYPSEYITSVEGTFSGGKESHSRLISVTFKTSKKRTSPTYGTVTDRDTKFLLEKQGNFLVGFHGWCDYYGVMGLGAYYRPPPPTYAEKLEAQGGDKGLFWDDAANFERVNKIFVGLRENGIAFLKFMYFKSGLIVLGDDHGNKNRLTFIQEFQMDVFDFVTSVEGIYDEISGIITMLRFHTDKQKSPYFGVGTTPNFELQMDDHQIVGFHGKSGDMLHQLGVHVLPLTTHFTL